MAEKIYSQLTKLCADNRKHPYGNDARNVADQIIAAMTAIVVTSSDPLSTLSMVTNDIRNVMTYAYAIQHEQDSSTSSQTGNDSCLMKTVYVL